tara:strand:+ start:41 stop:904 length:864 start_codon:yes stop_codon:yes gene_type:complete
MIIDKSIWNIDTLVLSSGGANGVIFFGAANLLKEYGILQNIKHYIGCSAGAITSALLACDIDPKEFVEKTLYFEICDWNNNFNPSEGILKVNKLKNLLHETIGNRTMKDINKRLTFSTLNLSQNKTVYIDTLTHPDIKIVDAVIMSSSIPVVFPCVKYNDDLYIDGAITDCFPIHKCTNSSSTLGIYISMFNRERELAVFNKGGISSIMGYTKLILSSVMNELEQLRNISDYTVLDISNSQKTLTNMLSITPEQKVFFFHSGIDKTKHFINQQYELRAMSQNDINIH